MKWSLTGNRGELFRSSPKIHPTALKKQNNNTKVEQSYLFLGRLLCSISKQLKHLHEAIYKLKVSSIKSTCCIKDLHIEISTLFTHGLGLDQDRPIFPAQAVVLLTFSVRMQIVFTGTAKRQNFFMRKTFL